MPPNTYHIPSELLVYKVLARDSQDRLVSAVVRPPNTVTYPPFQWVKPWQGHVFCFETLGDAEVFCGRYLEIWEAECSSKTKHILGLDGVDVYSFTLPSGTVGCPSIRLLRKVRGL